MGYELIDVTDAADWRAFHAIRRQELFEAKGRFGIYNDQHPDDVAPDNHPYLLKHDGVPLGVTRLDFRANGTGVVRLVAIIRAAQGQGHGRVLGQHVEARARDFGLAALLINAAPEAVGFYEKTGWQRQEWDREELVGIAATCVQMRKAL